MPKVGMNATFIHFDKDIGTGVNSIPMMGTTVTIPNLVIQEKCYNLRVHSTLERI